MAPVLRGLDNSEARRAVWVRVTDELRDEISTSRADHDMRLDEGPIMAPATIIDKSSILGEAMAVGQGLEANTLCL